MRTIKECIRCGRETISDESGPVTCYPCQERQAASGKDINWAVWEICKAYGYAPHAGTPEIFDILKEIVAPLPITHADMVAEANRNYDLGRKHRGEELAGAIAELQAKYEKLYELVELYVTTPNTNPVVAEYFSSLCTWYAQSKRPNGSEPFPIATDPQWQEL